MNTLDELQRLYSEFKNNVHITHTDQCLESGIGDGCGCYCGYYDIELGFTKLIEFYKIKLQD